MTGIQIFKISFPFADVIGATYLQDREQRVLHGEIQADISVELESDMAGSLLIEYNSEDNHVGAVSTLLQSYKELYSELLDNSDLMKETRLGLDRTFLKVVQNLADKTQSRDEIELLSWNSKRRELLILTSLQSDCIISEYITEAIDYEKGDIHMSSRVVRGPFVKVDL